MAISTIGQNGLSQSQIFTSVQMPAGSVLQVVNATQSTQYTTTSSTYSDIGLSASITPKFSSSKIMVFVTVDGTYTDGAANSVINIQLLRNSTSLIEFGAAGNSVTTGHISGTCGVTFLDSPATTSSVTYKAQQKNKYAAGTVGVNTYQGSSSITLMEIAV